MQSGMARRDAQQLVCAMRARILDLFPDGEDTYELIYAPRFMRLIDEFTRPEPAQGSVVIRFPTARG
jgi:hypothetical protein